MCYLGPDWGKGRKNDELSTDEVFLLLDEFASAGVFDLTLTGGEVCLRRDLIEILRYAGSRGFVIRLKTNATMIAPTLVAALSELPIRQIDVSLLGGTAETHDAVSGIPGSFARTLEGIKALRAADLPVEVHFTAVTLNFQELHAARQVAESLGCAFGWNSHMSPRDDHSVIPLKLQIPPADLRPLLQEAVDETLAGNGGQWPDGVYKDDGWLCGAGRESVNITPYGDVQPCMALRDTAGNLRENSFLEIWNSSPVFLRLRKLTLADTYGCGRCAIRDYCSACPGLNFMENGDVAIPSARTCEETEQCHLAATGRYVPAGSRDENGQLPEPVRLVVGSMKHPITLERPVERRAIGS
jgi:radical SAM protein with 4Fe4S-binding SPASM domain